MFSFLNSGNIQQRSLKKTPDTKQNYNDPTGSIKNAVLRIQQQDMILATYIQKKHTPEYLNVFFFKKCNSLKITFQNL